MKRKAHPRRAPKSRNSVEKTHMHAHTHTQRERERERYGSLEISSCLLIYDLYPVFFFPPPARLILLFLLLLLLSSPTTLTTRFFTLYAVGGGDCSDRNGLGCNVMRIGRCRGEDPLVSSTSTYKNRNELSDTDASAVTTACPLGPRTWNCTCAHHSTAHDDIVPKSSSSSASCCAFFFSTCTRCAPVPRSL